MHVAVVDLYRVFKSYRLGADFSGCECCVSAADSERLAVIPLHELSTDDLNRFAFKSMTTWGDVHHFKHFLPRLLELCLEDYLSFNDPETLLGKLAYANWRTWPMVERVAVEEFLMYFWRHQLSQKCFRPEDSEIEVVIGGLAAASNSISVYLSDWALSAARQPVFHLGCLINSVADEIMTEGRITSLWGNPNLASRELLEWICSTSVERLFVRLASELDDPFPFIADQMAGIRAAVPECD